MTSAVTRSITRNLSLQTVRDDISSLNRCCSSRVSKWATHTLPVSNSHRMLSCHRTRTERLFVVNHGYIHNEEKFHIRNHFSMEFALMIQRGRREEKSCGISVLASRRAQYRLSKEAIICWRNWNWKQIWVQTGESTLVRAAVMTCSMITAESYEVDVCGVSS